MMLSDADQSVAVSATDACGRLCYRLGPSVAVLV
jgi:hypothetical protein